MTEETPLSGLDPDVLKRVVTVEASVENIRGMLHRARVHDFTFYSDEGPELDGDDAHPYPLDYFASSIGL